MLPAGRRFSKTKRGVYCERHCVLHYSIYSLSNKLGKMSVQRENNLKIVTVCSARGKLEKQKLARLDHKYPKMKGWTFRPFYSGSS